MLLSKVITFFLLIYITGDDKLSLKHFRTQCISTWPDADGYDSRLEYG